jgi:hypothetical protein
MLGLFLRVRVDGETMTWWGRVSIGNLTEHLVLITPGSPIIIHNQGAFLSFSTHGGVGEGAYIGWTLNLLSFERFSPKAMQLNLPFIYCRPRIYFLMYSAWQMGLKVPSHEIMPEVVLLN